MAPLTKASPRVQKGADKALLALQTWLQYKSCRGTHKTSTTESPLEKRQEVCETLQFGLTLYHVGHDGGHMYLRGRGWSIAIQQSAETAIWLSNSQEQVQLFRGQRHTA